MKDQVIIAISVGDDAEDGLTSVQMNALNDLGLQMDFEADFYFRNSYLAIIDGGVTKYEATANRELEYHYENGIAIDIVSAGYNDGDESSILVDGVEYSRDKRGFNIVVCDKESGLVIDSVSFDVDSGKKCEGSRTVADMLDYWGAYEQFQIAKYK
jgi:hypothetical protein